MIEAERTRPEALLDALRRDKSELTLLSALAIGEEDSRAEALKHPDLLSLTVEGLEEAAGNDPAVLEALAFAVATRRQREQGECPPHWPVICECSGCGPLLGIRLFSEDKIGS